MAEPVLGEPGQERAGDDDTFGRNTPSVGPPPPHKPAALEPSPAGASFLTALGAIQSAFHRFEADRLAWAHERGVLVGEAAKLRGKVEGLESMQALLLRRVKMLEFALKQERISKLAPSSSGPSASAGGRASSASPTFPRSPRPVPDGFSERPSRIIVRQYLTQLGFGLDAAASPPDGGQKPVTLTARTSPPRDPPTTAASAVPPMDVTVSLTGSPGPVVLVPYRPSPGRAGSSLSSPPSSTSALPASISSAGATPAPSEAVATAPDAQSPPTPLLGDAALKDSAAVEPPTISAAPPRPPELVSQIGGLTAVADGEAADLAVHRIVEVDPVEEQVSHAQSTAATPGPAVNAPTPPHKQRTNHPILSSTGGAPGSGGRRPASRPANVGPPPAPIPGKDGSSSSSSSASSHTGGGGGALARTGGGRPTVVPKAPVVKHKAAPLPKSWKLRMSLRCHSDCVRFAVWHPSRLLLVTGSDDSSVKLWSLPASLLEKTSGPAAGRRLPAVEPARSLRGHVGPALCGAVVTGVLISDGKGRRRSLGKTVAPLPSSAGRMGGAGGAKSSSPPPATPGDYLATGGMDGTVFVWDVLGESAPPSSYAVGAADTLPRLTLSGHTDAVWSVAFAPAGHVLPDPDPKHALPPGVSTSYPLASSLSSGEDKASAVVHPGPGGEEGLPILVSVSADRTLRIWRFNPADVSSVYCVTVNLAKALEGVLADVTPTSVAFNPVSVALEFFFGTTKGHIVKMDGNGAVLNVLVTPGSSAIHHLSSHPTMALLFSAHADGHVRTYDVSSGKHLFAVNAHDTEVTSVASDPTGLMLMSSGNDCVVKWWSMESRSCVQDVQKHMPKWDEGALCCGFHPSKAVCVSAGADGVVNVFS